MTNEPNDDTPRVPREPDQDEIRKTMRAEFGKRLVVGSLVAGLVLLLVLSAVGVYLIRHTQVDNRTTLKEARDASTAAARTANRVEDCTTPGGVCFERAQRQTSGAVAGINTITVRATACLAVVLKSIPEGTNVVVDDVADRIQRCIQSTTATVKPQRVVPAPPAAVKPTHSPTSSSTAGPQQEPEKPKHPKAPGTTSSPSTGTPSTPTPTAGPTPITAVLCDLLGISPCPLP